MAKTFTVTCNEIKNLDDVFEIVGGFGRFQVFMLVLLLSLEIPTAMVVFSPVFTGATPAEWECGNQTVKISDPEFCNYNCTRVSEPSTIVSEWDLVCDLSWVSDFITTLQMFGMSFGNVLTGHCADWYGRRWTFLGNIGWLLFGTILSAVSNNVFLYAFARFICGVGFSGYIFLSMTYSMEFMTPEWRSICSSVGPFGEGIMLLGVLGYYFQNSWRTLLLLSAIPYSLILIIFPFLVESPRYLLQKKKIQEAHKVFNYIARINQTSPVDIETLFKVAHMDESPPPPPVSGEDDHKDQATTKQISYMEFFKNKKVRFTTFCLMGIWSAWAIMYFGISYNIKNIGSKIYLNVIFMGLCDSIGYPCSYFVNSICSRRKSLAIFMTGAAGFLVSLAVLQLFMELSQEPIIVLVLCLLGKLFAAAARASARTLTGESFPTSVRNMGFGIVGVSASLTGLLAPQLAYLGSRWPSVPLFAFAGCSLLGACLSFLLQETKGQPLNEEINKPPGRKMSIISIVSSTVRRLSMGGNKNANKTVSVSE